MTAFYFMTLAAITKFIKNHKVSESQNQRFECIISKGVRLHTILLVVALDYRTCGNGGSVVLWYNFFTRGWSCCFTSKWKKKGMCTTHIERVYLFFPEYQFLYNKSEELGS